MVTDASPWCQVSPAQGVTVARVEIITDEHRCGIDHCPPAVIGRCSQCALVPVDRATVSRAREKCRPPPYDGQAPVGCACCRMLDARLRTTFLLPPCFHGESSWKQLSRPLRRNRSSSTPYWHARRDSNS